MAHSKILLNDGSSAVLLNDGTSYALLNASGDAHVADGLTLEGTHATQAIYSVPRVERLIPVEFTFLIKAAITSKLKFDTEIKAAFVERVKSIGTTLTSPILVESKYPFKLKSTILAYLK